MPLYLYYFIQENTSNDDSGDSFSKSNRNSPDAHVRIAPLLVILFKMVLLYHHAHINKYGNSLFLFQPVHITSKKKKIVCIKPEVKIPVHVSQGDLSTDDDNEVVSDADGNFSDADVRINFLSFL